jgi:hypothetical protein
MGERPVATCVKHIVNSRMLIAQVVRNADEYQTLVDKMLRPGL